MSKVHLLNVAIDNFTFSEFIDRLKHGGFVITPNVDHLVRLQYDAEFFYIYQQAEYIVCDSQILIWLSRLLGSPLQEKISGSDLFPAFYRHYAHDPEKTIFLLGAMPGVAAKAQAKINAQVGREIIVETYSPPFGFEYDAAECDKIVNLINASGATVLAVGLGAPKQEKWVFHHRDRLPGVKTFFAIGATIDFEAGNIHRAPQWMSRCGLEWLFRLKENPKRLWRRYLIESLPFAGLIVQQFLGLYRFQKPLGMLLHEAGLLDRDRLEFLLAEQTRQQKLHPKPSRRRTAAQIILDYDWLSPQTLRFFTVEFAQHHRAAKPLNTIDLLQAAALLCPEQVQTLVRESQELGIAPEEVAIQKQWIATQTVQFFQQFRQFVTHSKERQLEQLFFYRPQSS